MTGRDKKSTDQYKEKDDILFRTDIKLSGCPLLGLKYSMEKRKSQEFLSKY